MARIRFSTKKELGAWCAANDIALRAPITMKQGWFSVLAVLPPSVHGATVVYRFGIGRSLPEGEGGYSHTGGKYVSGVQGAVPFTADELAVMDARIARLNEIDTLRMAQTANVSIQ